MSECDKHSIRDNVGSGLCALCLADALEAKDAEIKITWEGQKYLEAEIERLTKLHGDGADDETVARVLEQEKKIEALSGMLNIANFGNADHIALIKRQQALIDALEIAAYRFLRHIGEQLELRPGWQQYEFFEPVIDMYHYYQLGKAIGQDDPARMSGLQAKVEALLEQRDV